jgi:ABC-type nitrate/sulfonate/bicarbonate transport system permease component
MNSRIVRFLVGAWLPVLLMWVWWTLSADSTNPYFPPLEQIWQRFLELWVFDQVPIHVLPSLRNLFIGLAIGVAAGILVGAHIGLSNLASRLVIPVVDFVRSVPSIAFIPIFIIFFGLEAEMRIAVIAFSTCFPVLLATSQGVRSTDPTLLDTVRALRFSPFQILWKVRLPAAGPQIFAGIQLAVLIGFIVMIGSEILGAGFGIGAFAKITADSFLIVDAWTATILMGLIGYALYLIFRVVERIVLRWYYAANKLEM